MLKKMNKRLPIYTIDSDGSIKFSGGCDCEECGTEYLNICVGCIPDDCSPSRCPHEHNSYIKQHISKWPDILLNAQSPLSSSYMLSIEDSYHGYKVSNVYNHANTTWNDLWNDVLDIMSKEALLSDCYRTDTVLEILQFKGMNREIPVYEVYYGT